MTPAMVSAVASSVSAMVRSTIPSAGPGTSPMRGWLPVSQSRGAGRRRCSCSGIARPRRVVACRQGSGVEA